MVKKENIDLTLLNSINEYLYLKESNLFLHLFIFLFFGLNNFCIDIIYIYIIYRFKNNRYIYKI